MERLPRIFFAEAEITADGLKTFSQDKLELDQIKNPVAKLGNQFVTVPGWALKTRPDGDLEIYKKQTRKRGVKNV